VKYLIGEQTADVERTHLTSHQMNGRIVRTTLSFLQERRFLKAALCNCTRPVRTRHGEGGYPTGQARWQPQTPAMAAHHICSFCAVPPGQGETIRAKDQVCVASLQQANLKPLPQNRGRLTVLSFLTATPADMLQFLALFRDTTHCFPLGIGVGDIYR
jgi:hypothetical protein